MKRAIVSVLSLLFCVLNATTGHSADEPKKYWLAFSNGTVGLSLMQIDSSGNIVKPLRLIIDPKTVGGTPDAIGISKNGSDQLNLWTCPEASTLNVTRVRVDKNTFQVRSIKKTNVTSTNAFYLQVTQKRRDNFLSIFHDPKNRLRAAALSTTGVPDGRHWWLAPVRIDPTECRSCRAGGVSSDGRFAFYVDVELKSAGRTVELFVQRLDRGGRPVRDPVLIYSLVNCCGTISSPDVSWVVEGGKRFVVFHSEPADFGSTMPGKVYLQQINSLTSTPIGKRKILLRDSYGTSIGPQGVAVDPFGKFAIVQFRYKDITPTTYFVPLDAEGNRNGHLKKLVTGQAGVVPEIDILKE